MTVIANMKQGDLLPVLRVQLLDGDTPADLTNGSSVHFHMSNVIVGLKVDSAMSFLDPRTDGIVEYDWVPGDTDDAGKFNAEIEVTFTDGKTQTFPASKYFTVVVDPQLA